jgi:FMN-dependent NADH-azoreductase
LFRKMGDMLMSSAIPGARPSQVLFVTASPRGEDSFSVSLAEAFLVRYARERPDAEVDRLDAFTDLAPFGAAHAQAKMAVIARQPVPEAAAVGWQQVLDIAARVRAADLLLFAVPMWNGGIPWALKLFIDIVTQPGIAFRFDPASGYTGLLGGRRAVTIYTSRVYAPGAAPAFGIDHHSTYLRWWLQYCGITDIHELRLQPTFPTADLSQRRELAAAQAEQLAARLAAEALEPAR